MMNFYFENGFKLFKCTYNKVPQIPKDTDWRDEANHLTEEQAAERVKNGMLVGAWVPENMIVIDIDRHAGKADGLEMFNQLKKDLNINYNLAEKTFVVRTGSGGYHLYFYCNEKISIGKITESVDIKTHSGYVIACGSPNYEAINDNDPIMLPDEILLYIQIRQEEREKNKKIIIVDNPLSVETLVRILKKLDIKKFNTNDLWLEFCMSAVATCGNSDEVCSALEDWSRGDDQYKFDNSLRSRINSLSPDGGITAATFLFILNREGISDYMKLQVRQEIGGMFDFVKHKNKEFKIDIKIDYDEVMKDTYSVEYLFYNKGHTAAAALLSKALENKIIYAKDEKEYYFFDGNKWIKFHDIFQVTFIVLKKIIDTFYINVSKKNDADCVDLLSSIMYSLNDTVWKTRVITEMNKRKEIIRERIPWDSPKIAETLTLDDCVIDFSTKKIKFRYGEAEEYRRDFLDYTRDQVTKKSEYNNFVKFIKSIFPDRDTRRTAIFGLSLMVSGISSYRIFQVWHGTGRNGKSTLIEILKDIIGNRAITYDTNLLMPVKNYGLTLTPELASFQGALVAFGSETEDNRRISSGIVKNLVGDDTIKANPKHRDPIEFKSTWQLVLATNHLPKFDGHDSAFVDRLLLLPFSVKFYKSMDEKLRYESLGEKYIMPAEDAKIIKRDIKKESSAIIMYLIEKYIEFRDAKYGMIPLSKKCEDDKKLYIENNNDIGEFIDLYCEIDTEKDFFEPSEKLAEKYREFSNSEKLSTKFIVQQFLSYRIELQRGIERVEVEKRDWQTNSTFFETKLLRGIKNIRILNESEVNEKIDRRDGIPEEELSF